VKNLVRMNVEVAGKKRMFPLYENVKGKCAQSKQYEGTSLGLLQIMILLLHMTLELGMGWWTAVNMDEKIFA